ncbi:hypothetical protein N9L68_05900 [bacterium]|nr:hypothetical protein [bacterium]
MGLRRVAHGRWPGARLPCPRCAVLDAFGAALAQAGGTRVAGSTFKSVARLVGAEASRAVLLPDWAAGAVAATCRVKTDVGGMAAGKVLGVQLDGPPLVDQLRIAADATAATCAAVAEFNDAPAELALLRVSANVCRVVHLLRAAGPDIDEDSLATLDDGQAHAPGALLGEPLPAHCCARATCAAGDGGLGLRRASDLRFLAFSASSAEARSLAE